MEFNSRALRNGNVPNYYKVVRFLRVNVGLLTVVFSLECTRITSVHFVGLFLTDFKKEMEVVNSIVILFLLKRLQASLRFTPWSVSGISETSKPSNMRS